MRNKPFFQNVCLKWSEILFFDTLLHVPVLTLKIIWPSLWGTSWLVTPTWVVELLVFLVVTKVVWEVLIAVVNFISGWKARMSLHALLRLFILKANYLLIFLQLLGFLDLSARAIALWSSKRAWSEILVKFLDTGLLVRVDHLHFLEKYLVIPDYFRAFQKWKLKAMHIERFMTTFELYKENEVDLPVG